MTAPLPHENTTLFGHKDIVARLKKSFDEGKLHHALILAGAEGIGKETLAYHMVRYALAHSEKPSDRDDFYVSADHPAVKKIAAQSHPHIFTIQPVFDDKKARFKRDITLDALDGLNEFLRLMPTDDAPRFIIINPADSLNNNTQNALLKMLEEPPANTHFLLLTTQIGRLLSTIRSRCLTLQMSPLSFEDFTEAMGRLEPELGLTEMQSLFDLSQGALGQALQNGDLEILENYGELCRAILSWSQDNDSQSAMSFAEKLSRDEVLSERLVQIVAERLTMLLKIMILGQRLAPLIPEEEGVLQLWSGWPQHAILSAHDKMRERWEAGDAGYLDKKLILLQTIGMLTGIDR